MEQFSFEDSRGRTVQVPDGKWVADAYSRWSSEHEYGSFKHGSDDWSHSETTTTTIVGTESSVRHALEMNSGRPGSNYSSRWGFSHTMYVASEPFGLISGQKEDGQPVGGLYFTCARQVHKGELGRLPEIVRPQFARVSRVYSEGFHEWREENGAKPMPRRDQRRSKKGWARLPDVARIVGMTSEELVRRYFLFTHAEEPCLQVLFRERREHIHCRVVKCGSWEDFHEHALDVLFGRNLAHAWIRQGFAKTVLYLHSLGYVPELPVQAMAV